MTDTLSYYENVEAASLDMLAAAKLQDWDALVAAERRCAAVVALLKASDAETRLDADKRQRKAEIIQRVLAHDAEIRRLVDPRMRELERLLGAAGKRRRVEEAYTA
jgi:flagellar protein FliT